MASSVDSDAPAVVFALLDQGDGSHQLGGKIKTDASFCLCVLNEQLRLGVLTNSITLHLGTYILVSSPRSECTKRGSRVSVQITSLQRERA